MSVVGLVDAICGREEWVNRALCAEVGPIDHFWYPEKGGSTREAKRICAECPVKAECLAYALKHDEKFGVWGGCSERERNRLKRTGSTARTHCWRGHNLDEVGRTKQGSCRECHNMWNRLYQAKKRKSA